jgi:DNA-binding SARP family transcriptional activator
MGFISIPLHNFLKVSSMWQKLLVNLSFEQFHRKIKDKRLVILSPQIAYQNLFLSYFLNDTSLFLHYYRVRTNQNTISLALAGLLSEWDGFGASLQPMLDKANNEDLALAFARELSRLNQPAVIYLDELDNLTISADYHVFFSTLLKNLPSQCQLLIKARVLTPEPWKSFILSEEAAVLGTEYLLNDLMFSKEIDGKPHLEVSGFGQGHARVNGIEIQQWDGALPRNLFFYFMDKPRVTRDEIFGIFWPNLKLKEATNVYHVTKRKITEKISQHLNGIDEFELTTYGGGFYRPADDIARYYDVAQFEADVDAATFVTNSEEQSKLYRRAVDIYKAPFLTTVDMPWVLARRQKLQRQFIEALIGLARVHKEAKREREALGYFSRALRENPFREDLHREIMRLYINMGFPDEASAQYQALVVLLQDSLGVAPAPETQALYAQINA